MEFIPIYLLVVAAVASVTALLITKVTVKETVLKSGRPTVIENYIRKLEHDLERSRVKITATEYIVMQIGCPALLAFLACFLSDDYSLMLVLILLGVMLPPMALTLKKGSENKKFENRFVRALAQMAAALHAGATIEQSIESVIDCELLQEDIRNDFRVLASKMKLGIPISQVFYEFAELTESKDAYDVATAITIMLDVGGDAGVAVEKIQKNIEDRLLYRKKRESMMTESKMIAVFSDIMPILIIIGTYFFMPDSIHSYFQNSTMTMIFVTIIILLLVGSVVVHRMLANKIDAS